MTTPTPAVKLRLNVPDETVIITQTESGCYNVELSFHNMFDHKSYWFPSLSRAKKEASDDYKMLTIGRKKPAPKRLLWIKE